MARVGLLVGLVLWSAVAATVIKQGAGIQETDEPVSHAYDHSLDQSPWPAGDLQGQWHQQQRSLLQNPDRTTADWDGRKGRMEGETGCKSWPMVQAACSLAM